ncbi:hypothetical protein RHO13_10325 [Orbus wheelerorum]|uniref:glycosyltransferase n=1 Tax=Orbus wheelerorum TaxID=3074111 RepID=UPI00370DDA45
MKEITIVISTAFQDAGDATRAIEIAKAVKKYQPAGINARIVFISHGSRFEQNVRALNFDIYHATPKLPGEGLYQDLGMTISNLIGTEDLAKELLFGEIAAYNDIKPDIVLYGFWPIAGLARRMTKREIPGICFAPLPLVPDFFDVLPDIPEQIKIFSLLPKWLRLFIFRKIPKFVKNRVPILRQNNIRHAAYSIGWDKDKLVNVFDLLKANLIIVNDLPDYYMLDKFPSNVKFTGPLFAIPNDTRAIEPGILDVFSSNVSHPKIFCTLSSSGSEEMLKPLLQAFTYGPGLSWNVVILSPHFSVEKARKILNGRNGVYITDTFIPALRVNTMADITLCHGGQGTLQTALCAATPIVGVAMQQEQFINLSNIEAHGVGIRIPRRKWRSQHIQLAILHVLENKKFKETALLFQKKIQSADGAQNAADAIWKELLSKI